MGSIPITTTTTPHHTTTTMPDLSDLISECTENLPEGHPLRERIMSDIIDESPIDIELEIANVRRTVAGLASTVPAPTPATAPVVSHVATPDVDRVARELAELLSRPSGPAPIDEPAVRRIATDAAESVGSSLVDRIVDRLTAAGATAGTIRIALAAIGAASGMTRVERELARLCPAGGGLGIASLLASVPGVGKSYGVAKHADAIGATLHTYVCDGGIDEVSRMLTTTVPHDAATSGFRALNGPVTEAFIAAGAKADPSKTDPTGDRHVLFIDEILRAVYAQSFLIALLQPVIRDGRRFWRLQSQIDDGHGNCAVLYAPVERLHIVAAANLHGSSPDLALWSRLLTVRFTFDADEASNIVDAIAQSYGVELPASWRAKWVAFCQGTVALTNSGEFSFPADNRLLEQAVILAVASGEATPAGVAKAVKPMIAHRVCPWDPSSGETDAAAIKKAEDLWSASGLA